MEQNNQWNFEYVGILAELFQNVVRPTLCEACMNAIMQKYGEGGLIRILLVLETYRDWETIQHSWYYCQELTIDLTTVLFLLFPYQDTTYENVGLIREVSEVYGLNESQKKKIYDLRKIRNRICNNYSTGIDQDGHLEKEVINQIEDVLTVFDSSIPSKLMKYRILLEDKVK